MLPWIPLAGQFQPFNFSEWLIIIDGTAAFVSLGLALFVGIMGFLPFGADAAAVPMLAGMSLLILNLVLQLSINGGQLFALPAFRDFVFLGLSYYFATRWPIALFILIIYIVTIALPEAIDRCQTLCPFASVQQFL